MAYGASLGACAIYGQSIVRRNTNWCVAISRLRERSGEFVNKQLHPSDGGADKEKAKAQGKPGEVDAQEMRAPVTRRQASWLAAARSST